MTYDVLKDFTDDDFKIHEGETDEPLQRKAGETFIPAEYRYPQNKVDALVANGTLKLVAKKPAPAKRK